MSVYYNDNDPFVWRWLENLIAAGLLPTGRVDCRPIEEVTKADVEGFTQCHFFAGIGGWAYALQLAGWGDRPIWTGSCPCQPFSTAGKRQAGTDERHLWPSWFRLIRECRPVRIFGEQVAGAAGLGWLDLVSTDLEAEAYTIGSVVLGAHSVGAPHLRQRLWWVADTEGSRNDEQAQRDERRHASQPDFSGAGMAAAHGLRELQPQGRQPDQRGRIGNGGKDLADPERRRLQGGDVECAGPQTELAPAVSRNRGGDFIGSPWWTEPDMGRVAYGLPGQMGRLRAYGNAIVPQVAAAFVRAYMDVVGASRAPRPEGDT